MMCTPWETTGISHTLPTLFQRMCHDDLVSHSFLTTITAAHSRLSLAFPGFHSPYYFYYS